MPKYHVYGIFRASKYLGEFEADSEDDAITAALNSEANYVNLCHQCAGEVELNDWSAMEGQAELIDEAQKEGGR